MVSDLSNPKRLPCPVLSVLEAEAGAEPESELLQVRRFNGETPLSKLESGERESTGLPPPEGFWEDVFGITGMIPFSAKHMRRLLSRLLCCRPLPREAV